MQNLKVLKTPCKKTFTQSFLALVIACLVLLLASCNTSDVPTKLQDPLTETPTSSPKDRNTADSCIITSLNSADAFYAKTCSVHGIPLIASEEVPNDALSQAWSIIDNMLTDVSEDIIEKMITTRTRVGIIGVNQGLTDMPEYRNLDKEWPLANGLTWNERARGLGATLDRPLSTAAEENILCYSQDIYKGQNILVHEFAHTVLIMGVELADSSFHNRLKNAYKSALENGLWKNTYAATNLDEYWAVGVQDYYNTNLEASPADGTYNEINTREELKAYDPTLYNLIQEVFGDNDWTPNCPDTVQRSI